MNKKYIIYILLFFLWSLAYVHTLKAQTTEGQKHYTPVIGAGVGMLSFYGDISKGQRVNHPVVNRLGYEIRLTQPVTDYISLSLYVLKGKFGANTRALDRNLNFESDISLGGMALNYNFYQLYKNHENAINPYLTVGIEAFEFLSKTDMYDANGAKYYYWSDGSIRNLPEDDPNADNAIRLQRDYIYETDIRELNLDSFGKYPERSIAFPIGFGANIHVSKNVSFRIGATYHFTMTDYIDGITDESKGNRKGDPQNDRYLFTSFNLNYNLAFIMVDRSKEAKYEGVDFLALANEDEDSDGIIDFEDHCPGTPSEAEVDEKGCPLDDDNDGVPNYRDDEPNTPDTATVDENGVALTAEALERLWRRYTDSTGAYHDAGKIITRKHEHEKRKKKSYMVQVGEFTEGVPRELANILLSIPDVKTINKGDTTIFAVGSFEDLPAAVRRQIKLEQEGYEGTVVQTTGNGDITKVPPSEVAEALKIIQTEDYGNEEVQIKAEPIDEDLVYRVQLGAFSRKISPEIFQGIPNVFYVLGEDGLYRYMAGAFKTPKEAAVARVDYITKGFDGAFVVALAHGKRLPLSQAGGTKAKNVKKSTGNFSVSQGKVKFKVQIGAYKNQVPTSVLEKFMQLGKVQSKAADDGYTKYVVGEFDNVKDAEQYKQEIISKGFDGAFVVGEFNGKIISVQEAKELLNQ